MSPGISFILAMYRGAATVGDCLRHLQALHFADWECIAVDDASPDACSSIVERFASTDRRIKLVRRPTNGGVCAARNTGLEQAQGHYVHFLDQDDFLRPAGIGALFSHLKKHDELAGAFGNYCFRNLTTGTIQDTPEPPEIQGFASFTRGNWSPPLVFLADRKLAQEVGGLEPGMEGCDDWDLWGRMARTGRDFALCRVLIGDYNVHADNNTLNCRRMVESSLRVLDRLYAPDPRVPRPAPQWARGGDPALKTPTSLGILWTYAAICVARNDLPAALELLGCFRAHTGLTPPAESFASLHDGMLFASTVTGRDHLRYHGDLQSQIGAFAHEVEQALGHAGWATAGLQALHERYIAFLLNENQKLRHGMDGILRSRSYRLSRIMARGLGRVLSTLGGHP